MRQRPLLEVRGLEKHFVVRRGLFQRRHGVLRAVDGVDLSIAEGETLGLVGESGSGKTTLGRCILRLVEPTGGSVEFRGEDILGLRGRHLRQRRRHFQMVFQDPYGSLNPRMRVSKIVGEPLLVHRIVPRSERPAEVGRLLSEVGLDGGVGRRFPHELSGGQRQRVGIARALASRPELVIADEPVSALDVSVQAQIVNLLTDLQRSRRLGLLFIAHDLAVVQQISHRVAVLYLGRIVEAGSSDEVFAEPRHPYTVALLSAVPVADPGSGRRRIILPGDPPSPVDPPSGCAFHPRCPIARERCRRDPPELLGASSGRLVACHFPGELEPQENQPLQDGTF